MTPARAAAAHLPIVLANTNQGAFATESGAHHYRLVALEVSVPVTINNTGLIRLGFPSEQTMADLPHDFRARPDVHPRYSCRDESPMCRHSTARHRR